jgi:anti-sigma B factor antagonist
MPSSELPSVLPLKGEIDLHISSDIAASLETMVAAHPARLVVDLSGVTYIDSSGLAVLINATQTVEEYGGQLTLAGMNEDVRSIFEMARLDQFFLIFPHVDAAISAS